MKEIKKIIELIDKSIKQDPNNIITGGGIIKDGFDKNIDNFRETVNNSKNRLSNYQNSLQEKTNILKLKIKYTGILGYFIEIPKNNIGNIPESFIHKQTLVNVIRFSTIKLRDFEQKLLNGESLLFEREYNVFSKIRKKILNEFSIIKTISEEISFIDFIISLSKVSYENNYIKPDIVKGYDLEIIGGRHPVIEKTGNDFINNSLSLNKKDYIHIITGPNMGGKSTFLRQNALIILLAHIGSFIPANRASIPITNKIFSRVGAQDNLYLGQSTFMVEMQEVANILNNSTENSFVIIDEVGRGTSTYDGMSLAWAILKINHDKIKSKTLFATHYHELTTKSLYLKGVSNYSVAVGENDDNLVFLRKIIPGAIKKSYGIEVAKIAGLPNDVIKEAKKMLIELELDHKNTKTNQLSLLETKDIKKERRDNINFIEKEIDSININDLTPILALNKINELKNKIKKNLNNN